MNGRAGRDGLNVQDINGSRPPLHNYSHVGTSNNNYGSVGQPNLIGGDNYSRRSVPAIHNDGRVAGVVHRPKTGERSIGEIFGGGSTAQRIENRSLQTTDIQGAQAKRSQLTDLGVIAGIVTGSPKRKNESTVFSHLNEAYERDSLKRKDIN